jgi:hypothetical protein
MQGMQFVGTGAQYEAEAKLWTRDPILKKTRATSPLADLKAFETGY